MVWIRTSTILLPLITYIYHSIERGLSTVYCESLYFFPFFSFGVFYVCFYPLWTFTPKFTLILMWVINIFYVNLDMLVFLNIFYLIVYNYCYSWHLFISWFKQDRSILTFVWICKSNQMKKQKNATALETIPKSKYQTIERDKINTP